MKRFWMRCLLLVCILFAAVVAGMQLANDGLKRMKGYSAPTYEQVAQMTGMETNRAQGNTSNEMFTIEEKQKELERIKTFNVFSRMGDGLTAGVHQAVQASVTAFADKVQEIFREIRK